MVKSSSDKKLLNFMISNISKLNKKWLISARIVSAGIFNAGKVFLSAKNRAGYVLSFNDYFSSNIYKLKN